MPLEISSHLRNQLKAALAEDVGAGDATSRALFAPGTRARARIIAKQAGVLCGADVAEALFHLADESLAIEKLHTDGDQLTAGDEVLRAEGDVIALLAVERTALNFLARLSGIATLTRRFVDLVEGTGVKLKDTRKTTPLWRALEKYAVRTGGGVNHRMGLDDAVMVKDTHADALGSPDALARAVERWKADGLRVYMEARNRNEVERALSLGADTVMLDNQPSDALSECIALCKGRAECEITGGVHEGNLRALAKLGPDTISLGLLTHSAPAFDFSMKTET